MPLPGVRGRVPVALGVLRAAAERSVPLAAGAAAELAGGAETFLDGSSSSLLPYMPQRVAGWQIKSG